MRYEVERCYNKKTQYPKQDWVSTKESSASTTTIFCNRDQSTTLLTPHNQLSLFPAPPSHQKHAYSLSMSSVHMAPINASSLRDQNVRKRSHRVQRHVGHSSFVHLEVLLDLFSSHWIVPSSVVLMDTQTSLGRLFLALITSPGFYFCFTCLCLPHPYLPLSIFFL